jgi:hypothetical protein
MGEVKRGFCERPISGNNVINVIEIMDKSVFILLLFSMIFNQIDFA